MKGRIPNTTYTHCDTSSQISNCNWNILCYQIQEGISLQLAQTAWMYPLAFLVQQLWMLTGEGWSSEAQTDFFSPYLIQQGPSYISTCFKRIRIKWASLERKLNTWTAASTPSEKAMLKKFLFIHWTELASQKNSSTWTGQRRTAKPDKAKNRFLEARSNITNLILGYEVPEGLCLKYRTWNHSPPPGPRRILTPLCPGSMSGWGLSTCHLPNIISMGKTINKSCLKTSYRSDLPLHLGRALKFS